MLIIKDCLLKKVGEIYRNENTGWDIQFRSASLGKWFSKNLGEIKLKSFTAIEDIVKVAVYLESEKDNKDNQIHKFASIVSVEGKIYPFLFLVKENNGKYLYHSILIFKSVDANKKQKPNGLSGLRLLGSHNEFLHNVQLDNPITVTKIKGDIEKQKLLKNSAKSKVKINRNIKPLTAVNNRLSGVVSASDISKLSFKKLELDGSYKKEFGELFSDTQIMIWGAPGNGKTVWLLNFAQYLADKLKQRVLYIANEEWNRSTLTEKIIQFKIGHENLKVTKDLVSLKQAGLSVDDFDIVFFDSINSLGMDLKSYKSFVEANPGKVYVLIVQSTKDGDFRGGKDWEHEVDVAGEIHQRKLELRKNRLDKDFLKKLNQKAEEAQKVKTDLKAQKKGEKTNV